jgi:hypothetical protein
MWILDMEHKQSMNLVQLKRGRLDSKLSIGKLQKLVFIRIYSCNKLVKLNPDIPF